MKVFITLLLTLSLQITNAQSLKDFDGNVYRSITIGTQVWMATDLNVKHYRNGDPIARVEDKNQWSSLSKDAYCNYDNDNHKTVLYNWRAASDSRNIAPVGWHVPTNAEWTTLTTFLGGENVAGGKMELYGFHATGSRNANGAFEYPEYGDWWASSESGTDTGCHRGHPTGNNSVYNIGFNKKYGFAIRCIKDDCSENDEGVKK